MADWNTFTKRILINCPVETVYRCWATQSEIETWFLEKADYFHNNVARKPGEQLEHHYNLVPQILSLND
jgi:uncharacterized protein YndB with AHSA1/START domain